MKTGVRLFLASDGTTIFGKIKEEILKEITGTYGNTGQTTAGAQTGRENPEDPDVGNGLSPDDAGNRGTADTGGRGGKGGRSIEQERVDLYRSTVKESKGLNTGSYDSQGNPVDSNGKLVIDRLEDLNELTNEDFITPTRNVELPQLQQNISNAIGADSKPIIIKKNIFEKNRIAHPELTPEQSRDILKKSLYITTFIGRTQPIKRPNYWIAVQTADKNSITVLEVNKGKDNVEIVGWRRIDAKGIEKLKRQAEREGGQFLILTSKDAAAALSALPFVMSFNSKDSKESPDIQETDNKNSNLSENEVRNATSPSGGDSNLSDTEERYRESGEPVSPETLAKDRAELEEIFGKSFFPNVSETVKKRTAERMSAVSKAAKEFKAELKNAPEIILISDINDIPKYDTQAKTIDDVYRRMTVKGWYSPGNGKIYVNLASHLTPEDVKATILHEAVAHSGLRGLLGNDTFNALCNTVY